MTFANDCANYCFFSRKTDAQRKKNCVFRKKCAKVLRMETLSLHELHEQTHLLKYLQSPHNSPSIQASLSVLRAMNEPKTIGSLP